MKGQKSLAYKNYQTKKLPSFTLHHISRQAVSKVILRHVVLLNLMFCTFKGLCVCLQLTYPKLESTNFNIQCKNLASYLKAIAASKKQKKTQSQAILLCSGKYRLNMLDNNIAQFFPPITINAFEKTI